MKFDPVIFPLFATTIHLLYRYSQVDQDTVHHPISLTFIDQ